MHEWMNKRMNEWRWMKGWIKGWMNEWMNKKINEWKDE